MTDTRFTWFRQLRLPEAWAWGLGIWLGARLLLSGLGLFLWSQHLIPTQTPFGNLYFNIQPVTTGWQAGWLGVWQRWDAVHWMRVVDFGYADSTLAAFFPLYPLLASLIKQLTHDTLLSLLLVSNLALIGSLVLLFELVQEYFSSITARIAALFLVIYPASFFLFAPYAESLVLLCVLLAYRQARKSDWPGALLFGVAAGLTHPTGLPAAVLVAVEAWQARRSITGWRTGLALVAPFGPVIGAGSFFIWRILQGYTEYVGTRPDAWQFTWPWQPVLAIPQLFQSPAIWVVDWATIISFAIVIGTLIWGFKHLPRSLWWYQAALLLLLLSTKHSASPLDGFTRHCILAIPMFIALAAWCNTPARRRWGFGLSAVGNLYLAAQFMLWRVVG